eukprot:scaffold8124_cov99-Isochrysis_galbana.AAC.4
MRRVPEDDPPAASPLQLAVSVARAAAHPNPSAVCTWARVSSKASMSAGVAPTAAATACRCCSFERLCPPSGARPASTLLKAPSRPKARNVVCAASAVASDATASWNPARRKAPIASRTPSNRKSARCVAGHQTQSLSEICSSCGKAPATPPQSSVSPAALPLPALPWPPASPLPSPPRALPASGARCGPCAPAAAGLVTAAPVAANPGATAPISLAPPLAATSTSSAASAASSHPPLSRATSRL